MNVHLSLLAGITASALTLATTARGAEQPDNSANNKTENRGGTADQQPNDKRDEQLVAQIRKMIVADQGLSTYGHNIKILAEHGHVTLKGPVRSQAERERIQTKAEAIVGKEHVSNELEVAAR